MARRLRQNSRFSYHGAEKLALVASLVSLLAATGVSAEISIRDSGSSGASYGYFDSNAVNEVGAMDDSEETDSDSVSDSGASDDEAEDPDETAHRNKRKGRVHVHSAAGGNVKTQTWEKESGPYSFFFASIWVALVGSLPILLAMHSPYGLTTPAKIESAMLYIWLAGGLYLFTNVLWFQSPHFGDDVRRLSLEEAVYLFAQIITTVGYGDITPAKPRGQFFVGCFVFISIMLIANMMSSMYKVVLQKTEQILHTDIDGDGATTADSPAQRQMTIQEDEAAKLRKARKPLVYACCGFLFCLGAGTCFYSLVPNENKTWNQALYMSLITLSSVGFGAFTPLTRPGMVFGAFWMVIGVGMLTGVVTSYTALSGALKRYEIFLRRAKLGNLDLEESGG